MLRQSKRSTRWRQGLVQPRARLTLTAKFNIPRRGEIWYAQTGGKRHAVVVVSLDSRNASDRVTSILAVPFGSYGGEGPTTMRLDPGETGLPEPSFLKAHFVSVIEK